MDKLQIEAAVRDPKSQARKILEKQGLIPAELYGHGIANLHLSVNQNEFSKLLRKAGESTIIEVKATDGVHNVLIHDVQKHYLNSSPVHVDFYEVKMTEKLTASVALEFIGEADAVKVLGGTLVKVLSEVEVECLPADLPHNIEVDIASLKTFEDTILVKDLAVSDKVAIKTDSDEMVAKVQPPRDVEAELAEPVGEIDVTQVEGVADKEPAAAGATDDTAPAATDEKQ
jgi:large subunit ribosomal protein L25